MRNPDHEERPVSDDDRAIRIAEMNDRFRMNFYVPYFGPREVPGHILCSRSIAPLPPETQICIWAEVANFDAFTEDNDPHGEHDFGAFDMAGEKIFWKIDC
jgi:Protein of unknown function (DUF3768)